MVNVSRQPRTIMEVCISRAGVLKGARVASFIASWAIASQALDREITLEEYADWWNENERTAYRHQASFREVFPHLATPQPIANAAKAMNRDWTSAGVKAFGQLPADLVPA